MRTRGRTARRVLAGGGLATVMALCLGSLAQASHYLGHHWAHNGLAHSQIYFVDHTGAKWPVTTVTYKWNLAQGVDSYYESRCPSTRLHCVHVYEVNRSDGYWSQTYGATFFNGWNSARHNYEGVHVWLNNHTVRTAAQARKSTCHELGHVLGLAHRATNASCMRQGPSPPISQYPDSHDFGELKAIYAHAN
jgi:hypothetical protein